METVVANYRTNSGFYWKTKEDLDSAFSGFSQILDYLTSKKFLDRATPFKNKVENNFIPSTIADYINSPAYLENKLRLWDNLIAESVLPQNFGLREQITNFLRILHIFEQINAGNTLLNTRVGFRKVALSTVVLPKPVFPLPEIVNPIEENNDPIDNDNSDIEEATKNISVLNNAIEEITLLLDNQGYNTAFSTKSTDAQLREALNS